MGLTASRENSLYFGLAVASLLCDHLLLHFGDKLFDLRIASGFAPQSQ